ncbi:hypothetical protein B0H11DRAFT_2058117 [Mycena galericulata]|nr:hypothetical protein B0H11DRAFT_2058117 [Mycena galericulata]
MVHLFRVAADLCVVSSSPLFPQIFQFELDFFPVTGAPPLVELSPDVLECACRSARVSCSPSDYSFAPQAPLSPHPHPASSSPPPFIPTTPRPSTAGRSTGPQPSSRREAPRSAALRILRELSACARLRPLPPVPRALGVFRFAPPSQACQCLRSTGGNRGQRHTPPFPSPLRMGTAASGRCGFKKKKFIAIVDSAAIYSTPPLPPSIAPASRSATAMWTCREISYAIVRKEGCMISVVDFFSATRALGTRVRGAG